MIDRYKIWFGKDPEYLDASYWDDVPNWNYLTAWKEEQVVAEFKTSSWDFFWIILCNIIDNPPAMWYWVIIDDSCIMSGAIDPDDIHMLIERYSSSVPQWVLDAHSN